MTTEQEYTDILDVDDLNLTDLAGNTILSVEASYNTFIEDESFDYAGTHCTGGKPGTHRCVSTGIKDLTIDSYWFAVDDDHGGLSGDLLRIDPAALDSITDSITEQLERLHN